MFTKSLIEAVATALKSHNGAESDPHEFWHDDAIVAIIEVAQWLRSQDLWSAAHALSLEINKR
jgi:hypothetical protein